MRKRKKGTESGNQEPGLFPDFLISGLRPLSLVLCVLAGCARPQGPEGPLRRFLDLVAEGRTRDAYALTAPAYREQCDLGCFERLLGRSREELRRAHADLRAGAARSELRVAVDLPGQAPASLLLVRQGGTSPWLLASDPLDYYPQGTPTEALRSFVRAVEGGRWAVAARFVPQRLRPQASAERLRERWEGPQREELRGQIALVKRHLDEPPVIEGAEARLPLGERREARLLLEDGRWQVLQLQ